MNRDYILSELHKSDYWDERIMAIEFSNYADTISVKLENNAVYIFRKCYGINVNHDTNYVKDIDYSQLSKPQIPYFMQEISVDVINVSGMQLYRVTLSAYPLTMSVLTQYIDIIQGDLNV